MAFSLQDSASRLGEVMMEQTTRLQELRQQLSSGGGWTLDCEEVQALKEEMHVVRQRSKENQELSRSQAAMLESLVRTLHVKEELMRVRQKVLTVFSSCSQCPTGTSVSAGPPEEAGGALRPPTAGAVDPGAPGAEGEPGPAGWTTSQRPRPGPGPACVWRWASEERGAGLSGAAGGPG